MGGDEGHLRESLTPCWSYEIILVVELLGIFMDLLEESGMILSSIRF